MGIRDTWQGVKAKLSTSEREVVEAKKISPGEKIVVKLETFAFDLFVDEKGRVGVSFFKTEEQDESSSKMEQLKGAKLRVYEVEQSIALHILQRGTRQVRVSSEEATVDEQEIGKLYVRRTGRRENEFSVSVTPITGGENIQLISQ